MDGYVLGTHIDCGAVSGRRGVIASALEGTPTDDNDVVSYIQLFLSSSPLHYRSNKQTVYINHDRSRRWSLSPY
jgi:hypothetical protein